MAVSDARPVPRKNVAYRVTFPILDADGDLVAGAAGLDSMVSKDGDTFAACSGEAQQIATDSGVYYLDLTDTEMNADTVAVIVKTSTSGAKTTVIVMYPEEAGDYRAAVTSIGNDVITAASIQAAAIDFATFAADCKTGTGLKANVESISANAITATAINDNAITADKIAANAIDAATFAADVDAEFLSYLVDDATRIDASALNTAAVTTVPAIAGYIDTEVAAILAAVDTEVAAIKAKTDNLPASPAAVGSAMTLANDAVTAAALAADAVAEIADGILNRDMSTGTDSGSATVRTPRQALRFLRNKWSVSGTTLTVTKEDDSTASWTAEVTTDATANPITASDPASS